jgi:hypothetical protein
MCRHPRRLPSPNDKTGAPVEERCARLGQEQENPWATPPPVKRTLSTIYLQNGNGVSDSRLFSPQVSR